MYPLQKHTLAILLLVGLITYGTLGFMFFVDLSFIDSLYATLITITTTGFGEVGGSWGTTGRLFTMSLILFSVILFGFAVSILPTFIAEYFFVNNFFSSKQKKMLKSLHNHVIICGYGSNAKSAIERLTKHRTPFLIIEHSPKVIEEIRREHADFLVIEGDATEDETLEKVKLDKALAVITTLPSDADNLFIVLSARQKNRSIKIISRSSQEGTIKKMKLAGADNVIMPDKLGGGYMAMLIATPDVVEFMNQLNANSDDSDINLQQVNVDETLVGKSIKEVNLRKLTGCNVVGYKTTKGEYLINPNPNMILENNTSLIVLGTHEQIRTLKSTFKKNTN